MEPLRLRVMRLILQYYFWWRDDCFGLLIHHNAPFNLMVSISDECKYKRLVKTTFKLCGKPIFLEITYTQHKCPVYYSLKMPIFSPVQSMLAASINRKRYYLGSVMKIL